MVATVLCQENESRLRWSLGLLLALVMALLAAFPQIHLWLVRGTEWNGSYVSYDFDEPAYSAYVQALIDGRSRRNDPYSGRDDFSFSNKTESHFSIQFLPAYLLALPARIFGFSAADMFIALRIISAFVSVLAIFWLLRTFTKDERVAAIGSLLVLCLGPYAGSSKALGSLASLYPATFDFTFLRRPVPALPFPIFFAFCAVIGKAMTTDNSRVAIRWAGLGGLCFTVMLFSYFFLWTAAAAWFVCLVLLSMTTPAPQWRRFSRIVAIVGAFALVSVVPYVAMLLHRNPTMDAALLLATSRSPDFSQRSELFGAVLILILVLLARLRFVNQGDPIFRFAICFALLPFVVFNQQVITGYSLQSFHYERYIAPYSVAVAAVLSATLLLRHQHLSAFLAHKRSGGALLGIAITILLWATIGTIIMSRAHIASDVIADKKLAAVAWVPEKSLCSRKYSQTAHHLVFFTDLFQADMSPSTGTNATLWAPHMFTFSGTTPFENKERLYRYLYFTGVDERQFELMATRNSYLSLALFDFERVWQRDIGSNDAISSDDVLNELRSYSQYISLFNQERASELQVDYLVVPSRNGPDISNFDRWYRKYGGEMIGDFTIYRVQLRQ